MDYTTFGEKFRILRIKHHEVLADAKTFLGVSSAFISSVECGKRPVPSDWLDKISNHYGLSEEERCDLGDSIELSKNTIKLHITNSSPAQKTAAIQFQRSFDDLDEKTAKEIIKILERNK